MPRPKQSRYCQCGTRLGRHNDGDTCGPCAVKNRDARAQAPSHLPAEFWTTDQFRDAFEARHMGLVSKAYRKHPTNLRDYGKAGVPQSTVAKWVGLTQAQVSRIENGGPIQHLDSLTLWARTLRIPNHLLWFTTTDNTDGHLSPSPARLLAVESASKQRPRVSPLSGPAQACERTAIFNSAMQSFRQADRSVGGGNLYQTVVHYLQQEVAPSLVDCSLNSHGPSIFTAAAAITEMAGWMAYDTGQLKAAQHHFRRSLDFSTIGECSQLRTHIFASLAHLALYQSRYSAALNYLKQAQDSLIAQPGIPTLQARLSALQSRAHAQKGETRQCMNAMEKAGSFLEECPQVEVSPWISNFDTAALAMEEGRALFMLGDLRGAQEKAETILTERSADRTRSRAFAQLLLASSLSEQGLIEEACTVMHDLLDATTQLNSFPIVEGLISLHTSLKHTNGGTRAIRSVSDLDARFQQKQRATQWMTSSGDVSDCRQGAQ